MASMIFASSPLSVQSFVKLRTNSNYSHSPCFVSMAKNSYTHLPYKNISNIQFSKSLFTKGDGNFSFSSPKFPRVASKNSPSLNIIKACTQNIYHFWAHDVKTGEDIQLGDRYRGQILLIVNLPQNTSSEYTEGEMTFLNGLRKKYKDKLSVYGRGFEVLGFFPCKSFLHPTRGEKHGEEEIQKLAEFPIFRKIYSDNDYRNLWSFLRESKGIGTIEKAFEKYIVDGTGTPIHNFPWFMGETLEYSKTVKPGEFPGDIPRPGLPENPYYAVENAIAKYFPRRDYPMN